MADKAKEKASAADVVKKLTKDNITGSGKAEESIADLQSANDRSIKYLKRGIIFMSSYFVIMVILVLVFGLNTGAVTGRMAELVEKDAQIVSEVTPKRILINEEKEKMIDFNSGKGILDVIKQRVFEKKFYQELKKLLEEVQPLQQAALAVKAAIETSGVDTLFPRRLDEGAGEIVPSQLQATYPYPFQSAYYGLGCHVANCNFTLANVANEFTQTQPSHSIEECMAKCTRPANLTAGVEYGFTYFTGNGNECYCKTTGGQVVDPLSKHTNDTLVYVYYRFTWA